MDPHHHLMNVQSVAPGEVDETEPPAVEIKEDVAPLDLVAEEEMEVEVLRSERPEAPVQEAELVQTKAAVEPEPPAAGVEVSPSAIEPEAIEPSPVSKPEKPVAEVTVEPEEPPELPEIPMAEAEESTPAPEPAPETEATTEPQAVISDLTPEEPGSVAIIDPEVQTEDSTSEPDPELALAPRPLTVETFELPAEIPAIMEQDAPDFEAYVEEQATDDEPVLEIEDVIGQAEQRPLEETLAQLAQVLEAVVEADAEAGVEATETSELPELFAPLRESLEDLGETGITETGMKTADLTDKLLDFLRAAGYENPRVALSDLTDRRGSAFLAQAITYLRELSERIDQSEMARSWLRPDAADSDEEKSGFTFVDRLGRALIAPLVYAENVTADLATDI